MDASPADGHTAADLAALSPATVAVTAGRPARAPGAPLNEPVSVTSTYVADGERTYARVANPSWEAFETAVGALEGGRALSFASGMATVAAVVAHVPIGGRVVVPSQSYAGTLELLDALATRGSVVVDRFEPADTAAAISALDGAALLWFESPTNPTLDVIDVEALTTAARAAGVRSVVDNTFATPLNQRPLDLGADVVVHSATKFLAGHSDVVLGVAVTRDDAVLADLLEHRSLGGAVPGSFEAFLALRGIRTLPVRMRQSQESALVLAGRLAAHPAVSRVRYPGLPSDPGHALARRQMSGFGAVVAFEHRDGAAAAETTCHRTRLWTHATSLGGVESTLERRRRWEFEPDVVPVALVRLSVGCEDVEDLWADLAQAL